MREFNYECSRQFYDSEQCKHSETNRRISTVDTDDDTLSLSNGGRNNAIIFKAGPTTPMPYTKWGYRHQQCFIMFCVFAIGFSMRSSMGVALVAMTKHNKTAVNITELTGNSTKDIEPAGVLNVLMLAPPYPIFDWTKKEQNLAVAAFYWGYTTLQIPAGQLSHRFGARNLMTGAMVVNSLASIILPTVTYYGGLYCTLVCRFTQGLSQAFIIPGVLTLLGKWAPLCERGRLTAFVFGAQSMGTILGLPLTGFISASSMGWPGIFRIYGIISSVMAVLAYIFLRDTPAKHPKISFRERKYIEDDVGTKEKKQKMPVPWLKIFRHKGFYATIGAHIASTCGHLLLYSEVPSYMDKIMGVNIKANGMLTALPFGVMWCTSHFFNWLADWLVIKKIMSVTNTRKFSIALGTIPPGIGLIALAFAPHNLYVVEAILTIICVFKISMFCGFPVNQIDISPNFAGTLISISNFTANIGSSIAPILTSLILTDVTNKYLWRGVFYLASGIYFSSFLIYMILGTSERAEWNDPPQKKDDDEVESPMLNKN